MVLLILSVVFLLVAIGSYAWGKLGDQSTEGHVDQEAKVVRRLSLIPFALFLLCFGGSCVKVVPANSVGIPVTLGSIGSPKGAGVHFMNPLTVMHTFSTRLQESSMLGDPTQGDRKVSDAVDVRGSDQGVVDIDVTIRYTIEPSAASALFKRTGSIEGVRDSLIRPDTRSILRDIAKDYPAQDLVAAKRSEVESRATQALTQRMDTLYGIKIDAVLLRGVRPSDQIEKAIQAKLTKQQEVAQATLDQQKQTTDAETRKQVAERDAQAAVTKAQGVADAQRIAAQGEADANAKISASLTPAILQKMKTEALKNGTVFVVPDGGNFILGDLTNAGK